jgi:DNA polymerase III, gamma/tau subunits
MSLESLFDKLYGNDNLKLRLIDDIIGGRFIHTCVIEGNKGSGKHTLARLISAALQSDLQHREKALKSISPDVIVVGLRDNRKSIGVDTIRNIKDDAYIKPSESDIKIYIVEDTHTMTVQAQNAFLKLLEEPPANVYFILLCENTATLLATVKSRAVIYRMQVFTDDELKTYIARNYKKAVNVDYLIKSANGNIGAVVDNMTAKKAEKNKEKYENIKNFFRLVSEKNTSEVLLNNNIPEKRDEINEYIDTLMTAVRDVVAYKHNADGEYSFFINSDDIEPIADNLGVGDLLKIYDILNDIKLKSEINVNIYNMKITLLNRLLKE